MNERYLFVKIGCFQVVVHFSWTHQTVSMTGHLIFAQQPSNRRGREDG